MKQTAVEWLVYESMKLVAQVMTGTLNEDTIEDDVNRIVTKAKAMEKEQKKCYHPLTERKYTSDVHFECTICGDNNY